MNKDNIISLPHPSLRQPSKRVGVITDEIKKLINDMTEATIDWENSRDHEASVGLAAVQVNQLYRIFLVRNDYEDISNKQFTVFINPEIVKRIGPMIEDYEGCLSVPDIYGKVQRYNTVKVKAMNEQGDPFRVTASGFLARILQHETDHTNGVLFIDHIKGDSKAFFKMNDEGNIVPLDYKTHVQNNSILWDDVHED